MTMTHFSSLRAAALLAGTFGFVMAAAASAQAFTFNDQSNGSTDNAAKFADPVERAKSRMTGDSTDKPVIRSGPTLQFGGRESFDQRNSGERYFSPNNLMGR